MGLWRLTLVIMIDCHILHLMAHFRPQPTGRTSWKLVANSGRQPGFPTSCQLFRNFLGCQQGNMIDLSRHAGWQLAAQVNVENDQDCNNLPTSFQLVRIVGCGLFCITVCPFHYFFSCCFDFGVEFLVPVQFSTRVTHPG